MDRKRVLRNPVFIVSSLFLSVLVILGAIMPEAFGEVAGMLFDFTTNNFGWFYLLAVFVIILFLIGLAFSRYGSIRLGKDNQEPEFPFFLHGLGCYSLLDLVLDLYFGVLLNR